jgi:hypothetical protein
MSARETDEVALPSCLLQVPCPEPESTTTSGLAAPQAQCLADGEPVSSIELGCQMEMGATPLYDIARSHAMPLGARTHVTVSGFLPLQAFLA